MAEYKSYKEQQKYDYSNVDPDNFDFTDVEVNASYFVHITIKNILQSLQKDNLQDGFMLYTVNIDMLETICNSMGIIPEDYKQKLDEFKQNDEMFKKETDFLKQRVHLSRYKMQLLLTYIFESKLITNPLSL